jgi:predicted outer membrane repeat protein
VWNRSTHFRLGWAFSSLQVCLRCRLRIAARIVPPVIIVRGRELQSLAASEAVGGDCMPGFWHAGSVGPADRCKRRQYGPSAPGCDGASSPPPVWLARQGSRRDFVRAGCSIRFTARGLSLMLLSAVAMSVPFVRQAVAQIPTNPHNGTVFNLPSDLTQSQTVSLANGATLTVNGNGHTLTLSNGAFFNFPQNSPAATLALGNSTTQNITIIGGSRSNGGAISGSNVASGTSIPITGSATFSNNTATTGSGGAIGFPNVNGILTIGTSGSTVIFTDNSAAQNGGAISVSNAALAISGSASFTNNTATSGNGGAINDTGGQSVIIGDSSASTINFTGNTAAQNGGAVFAQNNSVTVNGNVTLMNNTAMGGNGGAIDEASNSVSIGSAGSTVMITGNTATANGGAIFSQNEFDNRKW